MSSEETAVISQESFLVADCGNYSTTLSMFDVSQHGYRLISTVSVPTSAKPPWRNLAHAVDKAVAQISEITGRPILTETGALIKPSPSYGRGIDNFTATLSAAEPLQVMLVGLFDEVSLTSARHALAYTYATEIDCLNLADNRDTDAQVHAIVTQAPDVVFIVGGTDGGADQRLLKLVDAVGVAAAIMSDKRKLVVLYAGNINLREAVSQRIGRAGNLIVVDNVRPNLTEERLAPAGKELSTLYEDLKIPLLPGVSQLLTWSSPSPAPTVTAFANICRYFTALQSRGVLGVDLGGEALAVIWADDETLAISNRTDLGMGSIIQNILDEVTAEAILNWTAGEVEQDDIVDYLAYKAQHPHTVPDSEQSLQMEQAIAREMVWCGIRKAAVFADRPAAQPTPPFGILLARGAIFANMPRPSQTILLLLDAIQPIGIFSVALDQYSVLPALGTLMDEHPLMVVQALEGGVLTDLGWVVVPVGSGQLKQKVMTVTVTTADGVQLYNDDHIEFGSLNVIPIPLGETVEVTLKPTRRFDIGFGKGQGKTITLRGAGVGLVIDARGRPIHWAEDEEERKARLRQWLWDMGG